MTEIRDRKTLLTLLESVNAGNRSFFAKFGKWEKPQVKVFWIEVDPRFRSRVLGEIGAESRDRELYQWRPHPERTYWIDAADERVWQIYTLAQTDDAKRDLKQAFEAKGADRLWFPETFLDGTRKSMGYDDRGFGISFRNLLAPTADTPLFSAKFWLSQTDSLAGEHEAKRKFIDAGRDAFALSTIRFGRNVSRDEQGLSGQLYELYHDGHLTVTTCDDTEEMLTLLSNIRSRYKGEVDMLEKAQRRRPEIVEVEFDSRIAAAQLNPIVEAGTRPLSLWLHPYDQDGDLTRYNGVDLHTGDFMHLDVGPNYSYLAADRNACMNMAPRYGTLAARFLASKARIYHDGVELFA